MCKLRACGCTESFANSCQVQECQQEKIPVISRDQVVDRYLAVFLTLGFELNTLETLVVGNKSWWIHSSLLAIFSSLLSSYSPQTFALYSVNFKGHTKITILTTLHRRKNVTDCIFGWSNPLRSIAIISVILSISTKKIPGDHSIGIPIRLNGSCSDGAGFEICGSHEQRWQKFLSQSLTVFKCHVIFKSGAALISWQCKCFEWY